MYVFMYVFMSLSLCNIYQIHRNCSRERRRLQLYFGKEMKNTETILKLLGAESNFAKRLMLGNWKIAIVFERMMQFSHWRHRVGSVPDSLGSLESSMKQWSFSIQLFLRTRLSIHQISDVPLTMPFRTSRRQRGLWSVGAAFKLFFYSEISPEIVL